MVSVIAIYTSESDTEHDGSFFRNCSKKRLAFSSDSDSTSDDDVTIIPAGSERLVVVYQILRNLYACLGGIVSSVLGCA